jgi:MFS family permease
MLGGLLGIIGSIFSIFAYVYKGDEYIFNTPLIIIGRILHGITIAIFMTFCLVIIN